jgi:hypothetical protein
MGKQNIKVSRGTVSSLLKNHTRNPTIKEPANQGKGSSGYPPNRRLKRLRVKESINSDNLPTLGEMGRHVSASAAYISHLIHKVEVQQKTMKPKVYHLTGRMFAQSEVMTLNFFKFKKKEFFMKIPKMNEAMLPFPTNMRSGQ